jgi:hypothetical protein
MMRIEPKSVDRANRSFGQIQDKIAACRFGPRLESGTTAPVWPVSHLDSGLANEALGRNARACRSDVLPSCWVRSRAPRPAGRALHPRSAMYGVGTGLVTERVVTAVAAARLLLSCLQHPSAWRVARADAQHDGLHPLLRGGQRVPRGGLSRRSGRVRTGAAASRRWCRGW